MGTRKRQSKTAKRTRKTTPQDETARAVKKRNQPRGDTTLAMKRLYDGGWDYSEEVAQRRNSADKGYYIHKVVDADIDPDDAMELFIHHNYDEGQRKLDESWSRSLAQDMATVHNIAFAVGPAGIAKVVNGQHSLWAIVNRGQTTQAVITIYMCRNEQAIADLYATFDYNKKRSFQNALHAAKGAKTLTYKGKEANLAKWTGCVAVAENEFSRTTLAREGRPRQIERARREDVQEFARWMDSFVNATHQRKLAPQGVGAAFYAMWKSDRINAEKFAHAYFTGENLSGKDPALIIRNKMGDRPRGEHASTVCRDHAELMYTAWRKFCLGEPLLSVRRTQDLPVPEQWKIYRRAKDLTMTLGDNKTQIKIEREAV